MTYRLPANRRMNFKAAFLFPLLGLLTAVWSMPVAYAVVFWTDDFESAGPSSGDRDAPNHADMDSGSGPAICGSGNYFFRTNLPDDLGNGLNSTFTNIQDSFYWRAEDLDACFVNPDVINWTGIDITGRTDLSFSGFFGQRILLGGAFEADDFVLVEVSIDGGSFSKVIEFQSDNSGGVTGHLREV